MIEVASLYCCERIVSADYRQALHRVAASMAAAGITPSTIADSSFNCWLAGLKTSPTTRSNYRRMGLTLWRAALDHRLSTQSIGRIARVKPSMKPPVAWRRQELDTLLQTAASLGGTFRSGCPRALYWRAWILTGYYTGIRRWDLHHLRVEQYRDGRLWVVQHKTGQPIGKILPPDCASVLEQLIALGDGETIFWWALKRKWAFLHFRDLVRQAGLRGSTKWLRRTGATHVEMEHPGSASRFLGHLSPQLAQRHYLDPTLLADAVPVPPSLTRSTTSRPYSCASSE